MRLETKKMLFAAFFAAIITICAQIVVPAGQVQFSLAVLGVFLCGALLEIRYSVIAVLVYILLGICGMPVFGRFMGGLGILLGPTGGYIMSYPFMVICIGLMLRCGKKSYLRFLCAMLVSLVICYIFGAVWLAFVSNISIVSAFASGVVGFVAFDIIKAAASAYLCVVISKRLKI